MRDSAVGEGRASGRATAVPAASAMLTMVILASASVALAYSSLSQPQAPGARSTTVTVEYVAVRAVESDQRSTATVSIERGSSAEARYSGEGLVTGADQSLVGAELEAGKFPIQVDGVDIGVIDYGAPLWRDLAHGDVGPDVASVQTYLTLLGYDVVADGVFGVQTAAAVTRYTVDRGAPESDRFVRSLVLWVPEGFGRVESFQVRVGEPLSAGQPVLRGAVQDAQVEIQHGADLDALLGEVLIDVGSESFRLSPSGQLSGADALSLAMSTEQTSLRGTVRLAAPIVEYLVPASSIRVERERSCVFVQAGPEPTPLLVDLVQSAAGQTSIRPAQSEALPETVVADASAVVGIGCGGPDI